MKRNRELALALALGAALLTLSGCDGAKDGTIDYIDGHWVFTDAQTEQSMDVTQLLDHPDAFYAAASAMGDEELQRCFDQLTSGQCAELFRKLGEERAMALAGRLTQPQVERLLTALQGQERVLALTDPAALAAVWQTLTTDEQLMALSGLSSEDYAALWALLDSAAPSPTPDAALAGDTGAPDMTDPAYLAGIWHTLTREEQSDVLSGLSSAQFVTLWGLLDAQDSAADAPATAEAAGETSAPPAEADSMAAAEQTPVPQTTAPQTSDDGTTVPQTPDGGMTAPQTNDGGKTVPQTPAPQTSVPQESAPAQEQEVSATPDAERTPVPELTDPEALADIWFAMTPEEQLDAIKRLTAEQFAALQELLSTRPRATPAEEDAVFIPSPVPTVSPTPAPPAALPTSGNGEAPEETVAPEVTTSPEETAFPEDTASPEDTMSPEETTTPEETTSPEDTAAPEDTAFPEETTFPEETASPEETMSPEQTVLPDDTQTPEPGWSDPAYLASIWHTLSPKEQLSILSRLTAEQYVALQELLNQMKDDVADTPADGKLAQTEPHEPGAPADDAPVSEEEAPGEAYKSDPAAGDAPVSESGSAPAPDTPGHLPPSPTARPCNEATPSEALPTPAPSELSEDPLAALSRLLKDEQP